jgi:hypothetical protein
MRSSHVVTALATVTAGLTAAAVWQRRADRRPSAPVAAPAAAPVEAPASAGPAPDQDGVVLPFVRRVVAAQAPAPQQAAGPARCGDSGGQTKAGAPCASRATSNGRCHHHRIAA